jgi:hypothetical protein
MHYTWNPLTRVGDNMRALNAHGNTRRNTSNYPYPKASAAHCSQHSTLHHLSTHLLVDEAQRLPEQLGQGERLLALLLLRCGDGVLVVQPAQDDAN